MDILKALANSLEIDEYNQLVNPAKKNKSLKARSDAKPIIQLNAFPISIDANKYKNAFSALNPNGDYIPLFAFRELVDPIPEFVQNYTASTSSTESVYGDILTGASVVSNSSFVLSVLNNSKKIFADNAFSDMDGTPGKWRPVYATPEDWHSADDSRFKDLNIDLQKTGPSESFGTIAGNKQLDWVLEGENRESLNTNTQIESIKIKYMQVGLHRPWYNPLFFETHEWYLSSENAGYCSSGSPDNNTGVFPWIPTSMIIGKQIEVIASWSQEDQEIIDSHTATNKSLFLGPFSLTGPESNNIQIIGWVNELIPFSPKSDRPDTYIKVDNKGLFIARFSVKWKMNGIEEKSSSGNFPILANKEIKVPGTATDICIEIEIMTFPKPLETWSSVKTIMLNKPEVREYILSGTTIKPEVSV